MDKITTRRGRLLTLVIFAATIPGPAWSQIAGRVGPVAVNVGATGVSVIAPAPSSLSGFLTATLSAPALTASPLTAPTPLTAAAVPVPSVSAAYTAYRAQTGPVQAGRSADALRGIAADIEHGGIEVAGAAMFDGMSGAPRDATMPVLPALSAPGDQVPVLRGPSGRTYLPVAGFEDIVRDEEGTHYQLRVNPEGRVVLTRVIMGRPPVVPQAPKEEESGLTQELVRKLIGTLQLLDKKFVDKLSPEKWSELIDKGLTAIVDGLNEPYTHYFDKDSWTKFVQHLRGNMTGIGILLDTSRERTIFLKALDAAKAAAGAVDDAEAEKIAEKIPYNVLDVGLRVKHVRKGSPAEAAGLQDGDLIVRMDGLNTGGRPFEEILKSLKSAPGTEVKLTVSRGGAGIELTATRAEMENPVLDARMVAPKIGYIYYPEFRGKSETAFGNALIGLQAKGAAKVIIDLRGNPGGDLKTANNILANLLPGDTKLIHTIHRGEIDSEALTGDAGPFAGMEKIVLVDGGSASASDLTAATLQDYGSTVVGSANSYGKFSMQAVMPVTREAASMEESETGIKITTGRTYSGKGRHLPGTYDPKTENNIPGSGGVTPDVIVPLTKEQQRDVMTAIHERLYGADPMPVSDPVLDKAIEILRGRP